MGYFDKTFSIKTDSKTEELQVLTLGSLRISVLTECLIRVEYQPDQKFNDWPTQVVWNRNLDFPKCQIHNNVTSLAIITNQVAATISKDDGSLKMVELSSGEPITNFTRGNLKGTARTLDMAYGKVPLENGILSRSGVAVLDDSDSLTIFPDGSVDKLTRQKGKDYYIFAYGHNYKKALKDFYRLTATPPLLPKFVFGNWWSRYHAYTQNEYLELMDRFEKEGVPLSVATIDMDWHWTDVVQKFSPAAKNQDFPRNISELNQGWTGYSWNTELFPDHEGFLQNLHDRGLAVTLNVHPSMGCRYYEDHYKEFAEAMGKDPSRNEQIKFDLSSKWFMEGYFKYLHRPLEEEGVDFWWIDWQQGKQSSVPGLDPLWALNHYHTLDMLAQKKRPLILSRYAGPGSHRYPIGFSGDTAMTWSALRFQPYFTATASNIGYTWWSHDIGGHRGGVHDDELYLRWLQFGVFSPINRLHSGNNTLSGKEPWNYAPNTKKLAIDALRFRQRLVPYLYSCNYRTHTEGEPLIQPMYYDYPERDEAYKVPNQYFFGPGLMVAPITEKTNPHTKVASTKVWLPEGIWTDLFTGAIYKGGRTLKMFRGPEHIPVLAKEGAIVPLEGYTPGQLEVLVFTGNGTFRLYDDDGISTDYKKGKFQITDFTVTTEGTDLELTISQVPQDMVLSFRNITGAKEITIGGKFSGGFQRNGYLQIPISAGSGTVVRLFGFTERKNLPKDDVVQEIACHYNGSQLLKNLSILPAMNSKDVSRFPSAIREQLLEVEAMK